MDRPRSRFGNWTNRRWWHFHVSLGVAGMLMTFPVGYFGVVSDRSDHQFFPSLVGAIAFGSFVGLGMLAFEAWGRRRTER
jgi:hypothetical protein